MLLSSCCRVTKSEGLSPGRERQGDIQCGERFVAFRRPVEKDGAVFLEPSWYHPFGFRSVVLFGLVSGIEFAGTIRPPFSVMTITIVGGVGASDTGEVREVIS
jgi:hypothetical protein